MVLVRWAHWWLLRCMLRSTVVPAWGSCVVTTYTGLSIGYNLGLNKSFGLELASIFRFKGTCCASEEYWHFFSARQVMLHVNFLLFLWVRLRHCAESLWWLEHLVQSWYASILVELLHLDVLLCDERALRQNWSPCAKARWVMQRDICSWYIRWLSILFIVTVNAIDTLSFAFCYEVREI